MWNKNINNTSRLLWYYSTNHRVGFISVRLIPNARLSGQIVLDLQPMVAEHSVIIVGHVKVIYRHLYDVTRRCLRIRIYIRSNWFELSQFNNSPFIFIFFKNTLWQIWFNYFAKRKKFQPPKKLLWLKKPIDQKKNTNHEKRIS